MTYVLTGPDGRPYTSEVKGRWGGYKPAKIYGRLDCPSALRAITRGGYARYRVFFADEAAAIAAGYRPCGVCCLSRYSAWKAATVPPSPITARDSVISWRTALDAFSVLLGGRQGVRMCDRSALAVVQRGVSSQPRSVSPRGG